MNFATQFNVGQKAYLVNLATNTIVRKPIEIVNIRHSGGIDPEITYLVDGIWVNENASEGKSDETDVLFISKKKAVEFLEERKGSFIEQQKKRFSDHIEFHKKRLAEAEINLEKLLTTGEN
jgi:hypothetical protein